MDIKSDTKSEILKYESGTRETGKQILSTLTLTSVVIIAALVIFRSALGKETLFLASFCGGLLALCMLALGLAALRNDKPFLCQLTEDELIYQSPVFGSGESFCLKIVDIQRVFVDSDGGGIYIESKEGKTYFLSDHFGNPARQFYRLLKTMVQ